MKKITLIMSLCIMTSIIDITTFDVRYLPNWQKAFSIAVDEGDIDRVNYFLSTPDMDVNSKDTEGNTALMKATRLSHVAIVERLLKVKDIDINAKNRVGFSALTLAKAQAAGAVDQEKEQKTRAIIDLLKAAGAQ